MAQRLSDVVGTSASFEDVKKYLRFGNDFCRDVAAIINERVKLEQTYSEGLNKLAARAKKATGETIGTMKSAWESFAVQTDQEAEIRKALAGDILEQIVKPFKTFTDTQKEARKQAELVVEKAAKALSDKKSDELKAKRTSFKEAKDSELLTVQVESNRGRTANKNELAKLDAKCKKAEDNVRKADGEHVKKVIETERARLALDSALVTSCGALQAQEEERIAYIKNMLKAYVEFMRDCGPRTIECFDKLHADTENINTAADIDTLMKTRGTERQPQGQILFTCFEADPSSQMDKVRRKHALEHKYELLNKALKSEKHARKGLAKLASVYQETPKFGGADTVDDVSTQIAHANAVIDCLDASVFHINSSLAQANGFEQPQHRLSDCIKKSKDKQNLPFVTLKVPFDRITVGIPDEPEYEDLGPSQFSQADYDSDEFEDVSQSSSQTGKRCRAIYEYNAAQNDELTIHPGDVINIIARAENGWWTGEIGRRKGVFPANYVEEI